MVFLLVPPFFLNIYSQHFIQSQNDSISLESFSSIIFEKIFYDFSNVLMNTNGVGYLNFGKLKILDLGVFSMK